MIAMAHRRIGRRGLGWIGGRLWRQVHSGRSPLVPYRESETDLGVDCPGFVEVQQSIGGKRQSFWLLDSPRRFKPRQGFNHAGGVSPPSLASTSH